LREIKKNLKQKPILINYIVKLMNEKPELLKINQNILNDEGIKKSLRIDKEHILKD